ncbi:MAG: SpoIIIAH-like family protein [Clostridiales bacterium]|nr:SpoIIIAH-like family protein [Clostridiales bacterium]
MKNIFKKNQIIITALAIMIAIAGYISFTRDDASDIPDSIQTTNPDTDDMAGIVGQDAYDLAQATNGDDNNILDEVTEDIDDALDENNETTDINATDTDNDTVPVDIDGDTQELGDISDQDILDAANNVKDTGEIETGETVPGEAILVSTTLDPGYFKSARLKREQDRAKAKADMRAIIENASLSESAKKDAVDRMIELNSIAERENAAELLLEAKGFEGSIVYIVDERVDVVINAPTIDDQQVAIIEQVIKDKTGIGVENMSIHPVVLEE